jgi:hypothetical protein
MSLRGHGAFSLGWSKKDRAGKKLEDAASSFDVGAR